MRERGQSRPRTPVLWVDAEGRRPDLAERLGSTGGISVDRQGSDQQVVVGSEPDCVVVVPPEGDGRFETVERVADRHPDLPVVACVDDAGRATAAFEAGATDVFRTCGDADGAELLARRVEDAVAAARTSDRLASTRDAMAAFQRIISEGDLDFEAKVQRLLEVGSRRLGTAGAHFSRVDPDTGDYEIVHAVGDVTEAGTSLELPLTYCRETVESEGLVAINHADRQGYGDHPSRESMGLQCYLGGRVETDEGVYGTLCFLDRGTREPFSEDERTLVEVMAEWIGYELQRRTYERERRERDEQLRIRTRAMERASIGLALAVPTEDGAEIVWVNEGFEELSGYDSETVLGRGWTLLSGAGTDPETVTAIESAIHAERPVSVVAESYRSDGSSFQCRIEVEPIYDDDGELLRYLGTFADVTERAERERTLTELQNATEALMRADSREEVARRIVEAVEGTLGFGINSVRLYDPVTETLPPTAATEAARGSVEGGELPTFAVGEGLVGEAFETGEMIEYGPDRPDAEYEYDGIYEGMILPLGEYGVVTVATERRGVLDEPTRTAAGILAAHASAALERVGRESSLRNRQRRLRDLVETTRSLMGAENHQEAMRVAVEAAAADLEFDAAGIRQYDPDYEVLKMVALAGDVEGIGKRPPIDASGEAPHARALRTGEVVLDHPPDEDDPHGREQFSEVLYVPVDDHGVFSLGVTEGTVETTDRRQAELLATTTAAALDRAERVGTLRRYQDVLETVQDMVFALDREGQFTLVTDPLADRLGYHRADLEGEHFSKVIGESGTRESARVIAELLSGDREAVTFETTGVTADGESFPVAVEASPLEGLDDDSGPRGIVGTVEDRTELERTRERLEIERDRFSHLFENLPDPVIEVEYVEGEPIVRSANPAFEATFTRGPGDVVGARANEIVSPPEGAEVPNDTIDDQVLAGEIVTEEIRRETADGIRDFLFRGIPYRTGERPRALAVYTDITEQRQRQRRLTVLNRILRHNIRNEMTVVNGYAEMLAESFGDDDRWGKVVEDLLAAAQEVNDLSQQAREVEKVFQAGREGRIDLRVVAHRAVEDYREEYPSVEFSVDVPEGLAAAATDGISLAVENLVENAIEHNDSERPHVDITGETDDNDAILRVADDGPGIPEHERAVVAGKREVTQLDHGSGIGLWVVTWIVEAFGGQVQFDVDARGTAVEIHLPTAESSVDAEAEGPAPGESSQADVSD